MENKILIKDALILNPRNDKEFEIKKSSLLIENDKIAKIDKNIDENSASKIINAKNKILMPGLVNTHTHLSMTLFRSLADDLNLDSWLNDHIWPIEAKLNKKYCYAGALLGAVEMIKSGTTTFSDMYFYMDGVAEAVDKAGLRSVLSYGMIDFGDSEKRKKEIKESENLYKNFHNTADNRIKVFLGPHSAYTCSKELLESVRKKANKYKTGIHIHMNETKKEIEDIKESTGMLPFEYLNDISFLNDDVVAAHGVWLSNNEIDLIKENNIKISHNPCSNMKLSSGIAPINNLIENNICVSLGTDGASSNNNLDMFEEMKFASLLQKVDTFNPKALSAEETIKIATLNGAKSLQLENEIGSIEVGKKADIILIDCDSANLTPNNNLISSNIVYSANGSNVDTTICNGKILMENKKLSFLDEKEIYLNANENIKKLKEN
ncbi:MAG: amidohydrolase family protein [Methanobacteriaceae archaeon]|jgi:5-methylthioadenosine/S-adenosylhomocysteine deaminase|nr:amidohydrolase family protein [Methanobacteriaceae archaeon]